MKPFFSASFLLSFALTACTDADWQHAMSFLPMEQVSTRGSPTSNPGVEQKEGVALSGESKLLVAPKPIVPGKLNPVGLDEKAAKSCRSLAEQRSSDLSYMGLDHEAQKHEYDFTYAGCMNWKAAHGG